MQVCTFAVVMMLLHGVIEMDQLSVGTYCDSKNGNKKQVFVIVMASNFGKKYCVVVIYCFRPVLTFILLGKKDGFWRGLQNYLDLNFTKSPTHTSLILLEH